jgi:hypothetical protein
MFACESVEIRSLDGLLFSTGLRELDPSGATLDCSRPGGAPPVTRLSNLGMGGMFEYRPGDDAPKSLLATPGFLPACEPTPAIPDQVFPPLAMSGTEKMLSPATLPALLLRPKLMLPESHHLPFFFDEVAVLSAMLLGA